MQDGTDATAPPRGLHSFPAYRRVFIARVVSSAGSYMQVVGATWLVFQLSGSSAAVGVLAALALGPALVGAPIGGQLADRYDPRRLAIVLSLCQAVPVLVMAALAFASVITVPLMYVCVFAGAIPFSLNQPVLALIVPATVPPEFRHQAVARTSMAYNITRLVGAIIGGAVVAAIGAGFAFAVNGVSYLLVAAVLASITLRPDANVAMRRKPPLREGLRQGWRFPIVQVVAMGVAVFFTLAAPLEQLMPDIANEHSDGALAVGLFLGAIGTGAILANPILSRVLRGTRSGSRAIAIGLAVAAVGLFICGVSPDGNIPVDIVALMLVGAGWEFVFVSGQGTLSVDMPADIRGSMIGLFFVLVTATTALGAVLIGLLFDEVGVNAALLIDAGVVAVGAVLVAVRLWFHTRVQAT